ncbi:MAG: ATP-binding protein [Patescibacteria group bacterium]
MRNTDPRISKRLPEDPKGTFQEDVFVLEEYIQDLWRFFPLPICYVNPVHRILEVNEAFLEFTGYTNNEIIGTYAFQLWKGAKEGSALEEELLKRDHFEREIILTTKEASRIPIRLYAQLRRDSAGEVIGYFLALVDITREKEFSGQLEEKVQERTKQLEDMRSALLNMLEDTEEARKRAEGDRNRTRAIITNFPDGLLVLDASQHAELVNQAAERIFDVKARDILGKSLDQLKLFSTILPLVELYEASEGGVSHKELEMAGGKVVVVSALPLQFGEEFRGAILALHDITREKEVERIKTEFVSLAAHQLRTPLSAIKWTISMLLDEGGGKNLTEQQRDYLRKTYRSNERMILLINDLLDVTRLEEGKYLYKPEFGQIDALLKNVVESHQGEAKRREAKLKLELPSKGPIRILMDAEKIRLVFQNLLENALSYTFKGGTITVSLYLRGGDEEVEVVVQDTGMGIPQGQQRRVFEKFFRATNAKKVDTEGSGLGLYLAKNIVEAHGGTIWFESQEGQGATFHVVLPVKKEIEEFLKTF